MNVLQLYTDETVQENMNFLITTTLWGKPKNCSIYENEINDIVKANKKNLGDNFKGFHANKLKSRNWSRLSKPYIQVIQKLFSFIRTDYLKMLIFIESFNKYNSNSKFLEEELQKHLKDRNCPFGNIFKHIPEKDLIAIYKRSDKIYNLLRNGYIFGDKNQNFEYYPDSSGKILRYKNKKCFVESPNFPGVLLLMDFFEVIEMITNNLASALNRTGWIKQTGQVLTKFEPKNDEDSYLIQTADIISNFFYNLIKYLIGINSGITRNKALALLSFDSFRENRANIKKEFKIQNRKCICINPDLEVKFSFMKEITKFDREFILI